jgi:ribosomal protein S14
MIEAESLPTLEKALKVNLDPRRYGTFAEIGAGQEVVRWFFQAGAAAGTIAKSISAYDMKVSDAIYGKCTRYVCRDRLEAMLDYEQDLNLKRLREDRGDKGRPRGHDRLLYLCRYRLREKLSWHQRMPRLAGR